MINISSLIPQGLILDAHAMSDHCGTCKKIAAIKCETTRKERLLEHQKSGACEANYEGFLLSFIFDNNLFFSGNLHMFLS